MYSKKVMDHFTNPRNVGELADADGIGEMGNPVCGDAMKIFIKVKDDTIVDEALKISKQTVSEALDGLPPQKMHCSNLGADALHKAIEDYRAKHSA
jgi:nitrogen fixation NifU-like protein